MNTYTIKGKIVTYIEQEIEAENEEEAIREFEDQYLSLAINDINPYEKVEDALTDYEILNIVKELNVEATDIEYNITPNDVYYIVRKRYPELEDVDSTEFDKLLEEEVERIKSKLPTSMELTCILYDEDKDDLKELIAEKITIETDWLVDRFDYKILD